MKETILMASAISGSLVLALAAAPAAQAFSSIKPNISTTGTVMSVHWRGKRRARTAHSKFHHKYESGFKHGFPGNCAMLRERAYLTDNAYWRSAYKSCRYSHYKYY